MKKMRGKDKKFHDIRCTICGRTEARTRTESIILTCRTCSELRHHIVYDKGMVTLSKAGWKKIERLGLTFTPTKISAVKRKITF